MRKVQAFYTSLFFIYCLGSFFTPSVRAEETMGLTAAGVAVTTESAKQAVEHFLDSVKSPDQASRANTYLNLEAMGQKALGDYWSAASAEQQKSFMSLLWQLIEKVAYPRSRKFLSEHLIEYGEPAPLAKGVEVTTVVKNQEEGLDAPIVYHLEGAPGGTWKIYDILLDGVPLTEDLKFQFETIIKESSFEGLLDRMKERLEKAAQEASAVPAA